MTDPSAHNDPNQNPVASSMKLSGGEVVTVAGGTLLLIASFLEWFGGSDGTFSVSWSGWSNALSMFPLVPLSAVLGASLALAVLLGKFTDVSVPSKVAGLPRPEIESVLAVLIALTLLSYPLRGIDGIDVGVGAWLGVLGAIVLAVGVFMPRTTLEPAPAPAPPGTASNEANRAALFTVLGGAAALLVGSFLSVFTFREAGETIEESSAWTSEFLPLTLLPVFLALAVAVPVGLELTGTRDQPSTVASISWNVISQAAALWTAVIMLCLLIGEPFVAEAPAGRGLGFWLMLLGSIALAGATIATRRTADGPSVSSTSG